MSNQVELILNYQKIDEELFKAEKDFNSNEDNQKYVRAVKKVKSVQEKLEEYEKKAQLLLDKYNSLLSQKDMQVSADLSVGLTGTDLLREAKNIEFLALEMEGLGDEAADL